MSFEQFTAMDDMPMLIDTTEILTMKQEVEPDKFYNTEKRHVVITFKNGLQIKVKDAIEDIKSMCDQSGTW